MGMDLVPTEKTPQMAVSAVLGGFSACYRRTARGASVELTAPCRYRRTSHSEKQQERICGRK